MKKNLRAADQDVFTFKNRSDVKKRKHATTKQNVIDLVIATFGVAAGTALLTEMQTLVGAAISFGAGVALLLFAKRTAEYKVTLERSEFLSALFSSALGQKHKFTMIVTQQEGQIVYLNNGFQTLFPKMVETPKRTLTKLFSSYGFPAEKAKSITAAVKKASEKEITVELALGKDKKKEKVKLSIEPIARPSGFVLIRGV